MNCRYCKTKLKYTFIDLGSAPPSNAYLKIDDLYKPEIYLPLKIKLCKKCWLVQTEDFIESNKLFTPNYAYFSSTSSSWLSHAKKYSKSIINRLKLDHKSFVIEIASNDGYLLKNFTELNIPCLGIEPTSSTAVIAQSMGIPVLKKFFCEKLAKKLASDSKKADLIIANNVYAHVPDICDFTKGIKSILKKNGVVTMEFPHLLCLLKKNQFDTIYHEHFSYLSLYTVSKIFKSFGLRIWHVEELNTHGGSLRVFGCHQKDYFTTKNSVNKILDKEIKYGMKKLETYLNFSNKVNDIKNNLLNFLIDQKNKGKKVIAYGAAAKGNTLLNFAGIKPDLLPFIFDASKSKQNKYMPGSHIPILPPDSLKKMNPDYILILPWNLAEEIKIVCSSLVDKNVKFLKAIPKLQII